MYTSRVSVLDPYGVPPPVRRGPLIKPRCLDGEAGPGAAYFGVGNLPRMLAGSGPLDAYLRWALDYRRDFVVWSALTPRLVVIEPDNLREVLRGEDFTRNVEAVDTMFGRSLIRLAGERWRERRSMLAPAFRGAALGGALDIAQDEVSQLIARWHARGVQPFNPTRELSFCMLRILGRFLFGYEFEGDAHGGSRLHRVLVSLASDSVARHFLPGPVAALRDRGQARAAREQLDELCELLLAEGGPTPFMQALRSALAQGQLDHSTAIDELRTFLISGHETSATAAAWAVAMLAQHPREAARLVEEGQRAERIQAPEEVAELDHSVRFIKETMRLYPAVPLATAQPVRDVRLGRFDLARGTQLDISCFVQHRLPWLWPEPERFDPDRFYSTPRAGSYLPFSLGPHTCVGLQVAMIELPLLVSRLAAHFELELPEGPPRLNLRVSLHPAGLRAVARPRC